MMADPDFQSKRAKIFGPFEQTIGDAAIGIRNKATTIHPMRGVAREYTSKNATTSRLNSRGMPKSAASGDGVGCRTLSLFLKFCRYGR